MDGTGDFFEPFVAAAPPQFEPIVVRYAHTGSYDELEKSIQDSIPPGGPFAIVAESFSGPLGVRIAASAGDRVACLVLCNTFVSRPAPELFAFLPWSLLFALRRPMFLARWRLLGRFATPALLVQLRSILNKTPTRVLAARMRSVLRTDERSRARSLRCRVLYLRGTEDCVIWERVVSNTLQGLPAAARRNINAPHLLLQTSPEASWSAIGEFLSSVSAG
jgi:pimeloyl-[acyl-carrier protein] methyl ester esterase